MARTGRPDRIDEPYDVRPDGTPRTIAEAICDHVAVGVSIESAARMCGIHPGTVRGWAHDGAAARARRRAGAKRRDLTAYQRKAHDFSVNLNRAAAACEARDLQQLDRLASGDMTLTTVTERYIVAKNPDGDEDRELVERTVVTKQVAPDLRAIALRLQRRVPGWQPTVDVRHQLPEDAPAGPNRGPAHQALAELRRKAERIREVKGVLPPAVIEATVVDERQPRRTDSEGDG